MWATLGKWMANLLLLPLIKWACISIKDWYIERQELAKLKSEAKKAIDELKKANDEIAALNALNKLP